MVNKKAEVEPWKVILGFVLTILTVLFILYFFTNTFSSSSENLDFDCWKLNVPGICLCEDERDCQTREGRDACKEELREQCYG